MNANRNLPNIYSTPYFLDGNCEIVRNHKGWKIAIISKGKHPFGKGAVLQGVPNKPDPMTVATAKCLELQETNTPYRGSVYLVGAI